MKSRRHSSELNFRVPGVDEFDAAAGKIGDGTIFLADLHREPQELLVLVRKSSHPPDRKPRAQSLLNPFYLVHRAPYSFMRSMK